jgi:dihydrofolate reductase
VHPRESQILDARSDMSRRTTMFRISAGAPGESLWWMSISVLSKRLYSRSRRTMHGKGVGRKRDMRKIIAALVVSVDGFIEGPNGELDWVETWEDPFDLLPQIDTCILGRGMYPQYEQYWGAILANPNGILPVTGKTPSKGEIEYAHFAHTTLVVSKTLDRVAWKNTRIVRDVEEIRKMKQLPGKDMHAVGGATLVCSLMNLDLIDELRLVVVPLVLGAGKALFKDVKKRHALKLVEVKLLESGKVRVTYSL